MPGRYAIISDIHANAAALTAVLERCRDLGVSSYCCLGDIIGYGASMKECVALVRGNFTHVVQGNHDASVVEPAQLDSPDQMRPEARLVLDYARSVLSDEEITYLTGLPHPKVVGKEFLLVHGALTGRDNYILKQTDAQENLALLQEKYPEINLMFFGHTHLPMVLTASSAKTDFRGGGIVNLSPGKQYLINPGSAGQPRDQNPAACFCIYDSDDQQVLFERVEYDFRPEQKKILEAGLPEKNARRLALGR